MNHIEPIADLCCGDERSRVGCSQVGAARGGGLLPVQEAITRSLAMARCVSEVEVVALENSISRVLARDLRAPFAVPPFDNSAMDGYAIRSQDLSGEGPWRLQVAGRIAAGDNVGEVEAIKPGQAFRIFTGAAMPAGADAVIMQEHVERDGDAITVYDAVAPNSCVRKQGEDAPQDTLLLAKGSLIGAREVAAIASVGLPEVQVYRRVRIALFCTGSELRQPGQQLAPGQIYNSNRFMLIAALRQPWIELQDMGAIADDPALLRGALVSASRQADMVVTTGGVSVGEEDHMVAQLLDAGGQIEVMKIAMKPGKPLSIGRLNAAIYVGLPGNPVAAFTTWKIIASRIAGKLSGQSDAPITSCQVECTQSFRRRPGRQEFRPAKIVGVSADGRPQIQLLDQSFSAKISLICRSDGFAIIPATCEQLRAGDCLDLVRL